MVASSTQAPRILTFPSSRKVTFYSIQTLLPANEVFPPVAQLADQLTDLKLGNGTSILIAANIVSALPSSVGAAITQSASAEGSGANLSIYGLAFLLTALGVVFVQEAERRIPMNYATRYENAAISDQAYLPFKVLLAVCYLVVASVMALTVWYGMESRGRKKSEA